MMLPKKKLYNLLGVDSPSGADFCIDHVTEDSRRIRPGSLFIAAPGVRSDGHDYAAAAVAAGAVAIAGNRPGIDSLCGVPYLYVENARKAAGIIAHALQGNPTERLCVIGVTGTNGKTSTAHLVKSILDHAGYPCANFGTIGYQIGPETYTAAHTTPFGEDLADMFAKAEAAGHRHVVMEVSSHALDQERVAGVQFSAAGFTNLTRDHLDYHGDMEHYRAAKLRLFDRIRPVSDNGASFPRFTAVNLEDPAAAYFQAASHVPCHTYGREADCRAEQIQMSFGGTKFRLVTPWGATDTQIRLIGLHNVANTLCAATLCGGLGIPVDTIAAGLAALPSVAGRFEPVDAGQPFYVIVDYAHTDDGLANVLRAAQTLCRGKIITVFGCGGDRDKGKRPKMGALAATMSHFSILTSDNPRTEDPLQILADVEVGMQQSGKERNNDYYVIESRADAIRQAISMAEAGDLVLIAGKGHENYQIIGTERHHFDDREVAREALKALT